MKHADELETAIAGDRKLFVINKQVKEMYHLTLKTRLVAPQVSDRIFVMDQKLLESPKKGKKH